MGWNVDFCGQFASYSTAVAEAPGEPAEGFLLDGAGAVCAIPTIRARRCTISPRATRRRFGIDINYLGEAGYTAANFMIAVLEKAGRDLTLDSFISAMESMQGLARHLRRPAAVDQADQPSCIQPVLPVRGEEHALDPGGGRSR